MSIYARTRARALTVLRQLDDEAGRRAVPLCPGWTVKDVVAHVCGINDDLLAGRTNGLGSDAWTARQVERRRMASLADICDEWEARGPALAAFLTDEPSFDVRLTGDLIVHLQDIQHALGLPIERDDEATMVGATRYVEPLQERVAGRVGLALAVSLGSGRAFDPPPGAGPDTLGLTTTPYDFLRSITGRRSRRQVAALGWSGDPGAVLDTAWSAYGDFPPNDIID